jgi:hypothetical protein
MVFDEVGLIRARHQNRQGDGIRLPFDAPAMLIGPVGFNPCNEVR